MHKCTVIYLLTTVAVLDVLFFLSSLLCILLSLVCTLKLRIIRIVFTCWKYNYGINLARWNFRFCFYPSSRRIHVAIIFRFFFTLRKYISNLQMQRFSSSFWTSWYSPPTKVSSQRNNSSWRVWRALKHYINVRVGVVRDTKISEFHAQAKCCLSHVQQETLHMGVYQWTGLKNAKENPEWF